MKKLLLIFVLGIGVSNVVGLPPLKDMLKNPWYNGIARGIIGGMGGASIEIIRKSPMQNVYKYPAVALVVIGVYKWWYNI